MRPAAWAILTVGCAGGPSAPEVPCPEPEQYWPDQDGDGVGEPTSSYVGCSPPEGWVTDVRVPPPVDTWVWDTGPYGDSGYDSGGGSGYTGYTGYTGATGDTGGTGATGHTGGVDTDAP